MKCVTSVSYSVLINGSAYWHIQPTKGIRQGDSLSPYLFLLCAKVLSQMIANAERLKKIKRIKISRYSPTITHHLFADDSLFFCTANNAELIIQIVNKWLLSSKIMKQYLSRRLILISLQ